MSPYEYLMNYLEEREQHNLIYMTLTADQAKAESVVIRGLVEAIDSYFKTPAYDRDEMMFNEQFLKDALTQAAKVLGWKEE